MVTHIQLHRSGVTGATPDVATLFEGEPAVNFPDKKLYIKDDNGSLITLVEPAPVTSVNGSTGAVTITDLVGVETFNGATGDVQGVGSFNGLTGTVDTSILLIHADGISADGATFGGGVTFNSHVHIPTQYSLLGQASSRIQFNGAGGQMVLDSDAVDIQRKLRHNGDTDTLLQFDTDQITLTAGNTKLLEGNANGVLHVPTGVSGGGATFSENVSIENAGDISLTIKGDTDNSGENDNPLIRLEQDGGVVSCNIGINGESNNQFVGAQPNAFYIEAESSSGAANQIIQFATNDADVMTLNGDGNVGINTSVPREKLEVQGTIQATGVSAEGLTCSGNIIIGEDAFIGTAADDERIKFDGSSNILQFRTPNVQIERKLAHYGDGDTYLDFNTNRLEIDVGGSTIQQITKDGITMGDYELTRPKLKDYSETALATSTKSASFNVDFEDGNVQSFTFDDDLTVSFTNPPASGSAGTVTLIITNGGANTTTWHSNVYWPGNNAPSLTSSGVDIISFVTIDAGTKIYGFVGGLNFLNS